MAPLGPGHSPLVVGLARDKCTCATLRTVLKVPYAAHGGAPHVPCPACQAWEEGVVLIRGQRLVRVQRWVAAADAALREHYP